MPSWLSVFHASLLLCLWPAWLHAAEQAAPKLERYRVRNWKTDVGLPNNEVQTLYQTRDGYIWIGTRAGLGRFDGMRFVTFNHLNTAALDNDDVRAFTEDPNGDLWIALHVGAARKRRSTWTLLQPRDLPFPALGKAVLCSRGGMVFFGHETGLYFMSGTDASPFRPNQKIQGDLIISLCEHPPGKLWIGHTGGLDILNLSDGSYSPPGHEQLKDMQWPAALAADTNGRFWMIANTPEQPQYSTRLWALEETGWIQQDDLSMQNGGRNRFLIPNSAGGLWMPNGKGVLMGYHQGAFTRHQMPFDDFIQCALEDQEGNLWVGTESQGLFCFYRPNIDVLTPAEGLVHPEVWTILQARDDTMWIGTDGGLTHLTPEGMQHFTEQNGLSRQAIRALAEDQSGRIWVGTSSSLDCIDGGEVRGNRFPGPWFNSKVRVLLVTRANMLWVGTVGGLYGLDLDSYQPDPPGGHSSPTLLTPALLLTTTNGLGSDDVRALHEDRAGAIWIGTAGGGLHRWQQNLLSGFTTTNGLASDQVWGFYEETNGTLWIATENGLHRHRNGEFTVFTRRQGLVENTINDVLEDNNGRLWFSGDRGVYSVQKTDFERVGSGQSTTVECDDYTEADGMPSYETNGQKSQPAGWKSRDGQLWFPTTRGVAIIDPSRSRTRTRPPPVVIEQLSARGRPVFGDDCKGGEPPLGKVLCLAPNESSFIQIRYTANYFANAERIRFKYRLTGFDTNWIDAGLQREIRYANLPSGTYTFHVTAGTPQNIWNETGAKLTFKVEPHLHQTFWFRLVLGCLSLGTAAGGACLVFTRVRHRQNLERQKALLDQRAEIARDLHDEIGSSLAQIARLSQEPASTDSAAPPNTPQHSVAALAREAMQNLNELVWLSNPRYDTLLDLVAYLREFAAKYLTAAGHPVEFRFPTAVPDRAVSSRFRRNLILLLKEALNNLLRHAQARSALIGLSIDGETLHLEIADDGRGCDLQKPTAHNQGLTNMRQRAESLRGTFEIQSSPGQGTRLSIRVRIA